MNEFNLIPSDEWFDYDLKITLKPSFRCNQRCWFCNEWDNSTPMWTKASCDLVLSKLLDIPKDKRKIFFYLYGGEPTLSEHWEYIQYKLVEMFPDTELFIQTQTNMSISKSRLTVFLNKINKIKKTKHTIDICSSYHLGKQKVEDFIDKMKICDDLNALGFSFFSTEIEKEDQFLSEFFKIAEKFPDKLKIKFTQIHDLVSKINRPIYVKLLEDEYLKGDDSGESLECRYFLRKYPELKKYLEHSWTFNIDGDYLNYSEVKARGIHYKFKYMKCAAGKKSIVIDENLYAWRCNDYYYSKIDPIHIDKLNINEYLSKDIRCLSCKCTDGLDHMKCK